MSRWILAMAIIVVAAEVAQAQVISTYGGTGGVYVPGSAYAVAAPSPAVTSAYYSAPAYSSAAPVYGPPAYGYSTPVYGPPVYAQPVFAAPSQIVQMAYSVPAYSAPVVVAPPVYAAPVYAAPVPLYGPNYVRQTTRSLPHNYTQVTRVYGPTPGPHYSRVHVHNGPLGTTIRERIR